MQHLPRQRRAQGEAKLFSASWIPWVDTFFEAEEASSSSQNPTGFFPLPSAFLEEVALLGFLEEFPALMRKKD